MKVNRRFNRQRSVAALRQGREAPRFNLHPYQYRVLKRLRQYAQQHMTFLPQDAGRS